MPDAEKPKEMIKVALLDDNFAIRNTVRTFLHKVGGNLGVDIKVYTSQDGVEGLGYIYAADPDIVIVDTTLPKYSGRELLDYLASNTKFRESGKRVIVILDDGSKRPQIPKDYIVIKKSRRHFLTDLIGEVARLIRQNSILDKKDIPQGKLAAIANTTLFLANKGDRAVERAEDAIWPIKLVWWSWWLVLQAVVSIGLTITQLLVGETQDNNVQQHTQDIWTFRVRHYPTVIASVAGMLFVVVQVSAYVVASIAVLNLSGRVELAEAAYANGYTYRRSITIDNTDVAGSANHTDFPIVVSGTYAYLATTGNGGKVENANGYDIIFTSDEAGSSVLDHEIERYVATTGEVTMWIRIPTLDYDNDTIIYMFYGNSSVSTSQEDVAGVWGASYESVYHFDEDPTAGAPQMLNSKANTNQGTAGGTWAGGDLTTAKIGRGLNFDAAQSDRIAATDNLSGSTLTVSAWVNADVLSADYVTVAMRSNSGVNDLDYNLYVRDLYSPSGSNRPTGFVNRTTGGYLSAGGDSALSTGTWYYLAFSYDSADIKLFRDGVLRNTTNCASNCGINDSNRDVWVGGSEAWGEHFDGKIDEFRVSSVARSADWLLTEYNNQNSPASFYTLGDEETSEAAAATVSTLGSQTTTLDIGKSNQHIGGAFVITPASGTIEVTGITITENGSINGSTGLDNIKLFYEKDTSNPYDCSSESYAGSETQFGSTDTDGFSGANGTASYTGSVSVSLTEAMCIYAVLDTTGLGASGNTIEIQIANPSTDVTLASGSVTPATAVSIAGTTTIAAPTDFANGYNFRRAIVVDHNDVAGSGDFSDFQLLVAGTYEDLRTIANGGKVTSELGHDIRFYSDSAGTSALYHELDHYRVDSGEVAFWVRVPTLDHNDDTTVYMFYGNDEVVSATEDSENTWTSDYKLVYHMSESNHTADATILDSTSNNLDSTNLALTQQGAAGKIGVAPIFNGTDNFITRAYSATLTLTGSMTVSAWVKMASGDEGGLVSKHDAAGTSNYTIRLNPSNSKAQFGKYSGSYTYVSSDGTVSNDTWYHIVGVHDSGGATARIYINGTPTEAAFSGGLPSNTEPLRVGRDREGNFFGGQIDEVRVIGTNLSEDRIVTEYNNQNDPSSFYTLGSEFGDAPVASVSVATVGTQQAALDIPSTNEYIGGAFSITVTNANTTVTGITITEQGTVNAATALDNIKLYYEKDTSNPYNCSSESYAGPESQFGATDTDGFSAANGTSSFTGSVALTADTEALCVYVVLDVLDTAGDTETIDIQITTPSTDITLGSGSVSTGSSVAISGSTTLDAGDAPLFDNGYDYRRSITIDEAQVSGSADHTNFPVYIGGTYSYLATTGNGGGVTNANGYDIIFTSDEAGVTPLDHEIETYVASTGEVAMWVRIPTLDYNDDTVIYMFYGNSDISTSQEDIEGTWNSNYRMVQHMNETNGSNNQQLVDSTTNNNDSSSVTVTSQNVAGLLGKTMDFDGTDDVVVFPDTASLEITSTFTVQAWIYADSTSLKGIVSRHNATDRNTYRLETNTSGRIRFGWYWGGISTLDSSTSSFTTGAWYHLAGVFDDTNNFRRIYVNGVQRGNQTQTGNPPADSGTTELEIGANRDNNYFNGLIDEVRISNTARSVDWLLTEYNNGSSPSTFYAIGDEEPALPANSAPVLTDIILNGGEDINLTENTNTEVSLTAVITDADGYADIDTLNAKLYRSGVSGAEACSVDDNNCVSYFDSALTNCSGTTCDVEMVFSLEFHADPTDSGAYSSEYWVGWISVTDDASASDTAFSASNVTDVNSLIALNATSSVNYGTLLPGENTGATNQSITITNTGNVAIDLNISGTALCPDFPTCASVTIPVGNQEYALAPFTYGAGTDLSTTPTAVDISLPRATSIVSPSTDITYWGIALPNPLASGSFTGSITISAVGDS